MVFLAPMLSDAEIAELYREEYFTECSETCGAHGNAAYMELADESTDQRAQAALRVDRLIRSQHSVGGTLLEVGCGPGFLLAEMRELGWRVRGIEISEYAARHAREKLDLEVENSALDGAAVSPGSVDAVFMGDVLEHLPRPLESMKRIRGWLATDGVVVVAIPSTLNLASARIGLWLYRVRGRFKTLKIPPYHLYEYTPHSVRRLLNKAGFEVERLEQSTVPLKRMGLRGSPLENVGKAVLQVIAHASCRLFNRGGDRLLIVARKTDL